MSTTSTAQFFRVRSSKHHNLSNLSMTIGNRRVELYTDNMGILREIREGGGHPFISADVAHALEGMPATDGWVAIPISQDEPEPEEEVVPVEITESGGIRLASGNVAARLTEVLHEKRHLNTLLAMHERRSDELLAEIAVYKSKSEEDEQIIRLLQEEVASLQLDRPTLVTPPEDQMPAAPMVGKGGRLVKARKNHITELHADDGSVATLEAEQDKIQVDMSALDDIPRT
jgi:hypothetical protein